jgi:hypothetical protein
LGAAPLTVSLVEPDGAAGIDRFADYLRILALRDLLGLCNLHDLVVANYANVGGRPMPFLFAPARAALLTSADLTARPMLADAGIDPAWVHVQSKVDGSEMRDTGHGRLFRMLAPPAQCG